MELRETTCAASAAVVAAAFELHVTFKQIYEPRHHHQTHFRATSHKSTLWMQVRATVVVAHLRHVRVSGLACVSGVKWSCVTC